MSLLAGDGRPREGHVVSTAMRLVDPLADGRWDAFVASHPGATPYHLGAWSRILAAAYRFSPVYLALEDGQGRLLGVLPCVYKTGPLSGRRQRSLPVFSQGGPIAGTPEQAAALVNEARRLADERGAVLELCSRDGGLGALVAPLCAQARSPSWLIELPSDADELRRGVKKRSRNLHRSIAKAEAAGLTVREGRSRHDLRAFYTLYLRTVKKHGALPASYRLFAASRRLLSPAGSFQLLLVEKDARLLAGAVSYGVGRTLEVSFLGSDDRYLDLRPHHALYWEAIRRGIAAGHSHLSLGRTRAESSQGAFKAQWGAEPVGEFEYLHPGPAGEGPAGRGSLRLWQRRLPAAAWERAPLPVTRAVGALAGRYL